MKESPCEKWWRKEEEEEEEEKEKRLKGCSHSLPYGGERKGVEGG